MNSANIYSETTLPTLLGSFRTLIYRDQDNAETVVLVSGNVQGKYRVPVRVHSSCFTSEVLGSLKCDCREQLEFAMRYIEANGGVLIYLNQEGRGIGLGNKIRAYALQQKGVDTVDANLALGLPHDSRTYEVAASIIKDLGVLSIELMTNNPDKIRALKQLGIDIENRLPVEIVGNSHSRFYLDTKRRRMGHLLSEIYDDRAFKKHERPFVHINFAMNSKGEVNSSKISCTQDWQRVHELRERYASIGVGGVTWIKDKPKLNVREEYLKRQPRYQPIRVIFAGSHNCEVPSDGRPTFLIGTSAPMNKDITHIYGEDRLLEKPLCQLLQAGVNSILVEGGPTLLHSFLSQGMVDKFSVYVRTQEKEEALVTACKSISELDDNLTAIACGEGIVISKTFEHSVLRID